MLRPLNVLLSPIFVLFITTTTATASNASTLLHLPAVYPNHSNIRNGPLAVAFYYQSSWDGEMTVSQVIVDDSSITWIELSAGSDELSLNVSAIMQQQLEIVFNHSSIPYSSLVIKVLKKGSSPASSIAVEFSAEVNDFVPSSDDLSSYVEAVNLLLEATIREMSADGSFDESFGPDATVSIIVTKITPSQTPDNPDDDNATLVAIIVCSVVGGLTLILLLTYTILRCRLKKLVEKGAPGNELYGSDVFISKSADPNTNSSSAPNTETETFTMNSSSVIDFDTQPGALDANEIKKTKIKEVTSASQLLVMSSTFDNAAFTSEPPVSNFSQESVVNVTVFKSAEGYTNVAIMSTDVDESELSF